MRSVFRFSLGAVLAAGCVATSMAKSPPTTIAGGGRTLMPGLIDNHVHITMSASSQRDLVGPQIAPELLQARAPEEAGQMLLRGFTSVRDMGGPVFELNAAIDAGKTPGPRICPSGAMISQTSGHGDSRLPNEKSRRFFGAVSRGELLGANFIADGRDEVLTATRENLRGGAKLLDEPTMKLLAARGVWLSLQALDEAPESQTSDVKAKKHQVVAGTDNAFQWARKYKIKLAWGTDFLFNPAQNKNQNADILKLRQGFKPAELLRLVTHDNARLLALSGPRNPYPGQLGVVETGALADLLLVDGDPIAQPELIGDPQRNFLVIVKDGRIYKNQLP